MLDRVTQYLQLVRELDLKLVTALDTHIHADHVIGIGRLFLVRHGGETVARLRVLQATGSAKVTQQAAP